MSLKVLGFTHSLLMLLTFSLLISCGKQHSDNALPNTKTTFNLQTVKQRYGDIAFSVADISEQSYENGTAIAVTLSVPLNPADDFQSFFKISESSGQLLEGGWILSASGLVAYFPAIQPASSYTVEILKGLSAATGKQLQQNVQQQLTTRKMPAQVSFASKGSILPAKLAKGFPVISVNVKEVDVDFHRLQQDKISQFLSDWNNRSSQGSYYLKKYTAYSELVYSGRFVLDPPANTRFTTHLNLSGIISLQQPGIYLAVMKPAGRYPYELQVSYFVVTDIGLHTRLYHDRMTVFTRSLASGKPLAGIDLTLLDKQGQMVAKSKTSSHGQAEFIAPDRQARVLLASDANNISLLQLKTPALDLTEFDIAGRVQKALEIFLYSPQDLYRPGETVTISAILRDADGRTIPAPPLNAVIKRPDGLKIKYFTWRSETLGYYQTTFKLPDHARTGKWQLEITTADKSRYHYDFKVAAFLPERMALQLAEINKAYWTDNTSALRIPVTGQYLYGAPAAGNRLSTRILLTTNRHPISTLPDYYFGDTYEKPPVGYFKTDDLQLDSQGKAVLNIASRWQKARHSAFNIKIISSLYETGGRPITRSLVYRLWPQATLLGIRPQRKLDAIPANSQINFDIIKSDRFGQQATGDITVSLTRERRDYYWAYSDTEGWHNAFTEKNYPVFKQQLSLDEAQPAHIQVPVEWGRYRLQVKDLQSGQVSSLRFYAGSGWQGQGDAVAHPDRITLKLDKKHYHAGDTARVKITPPYTGSGFVVVENSEQTLWQQRATLPVEGLVLDIPIAKNWQRHDLYISALVFRPGNSQQTISPNRAIGLIHLPLDREDRHLQIKMVTPKQSIRPETRLQTRIKVIGAAAGQKTLLTLAAVDAGVLSITDYQTPDPFQWFFAPRRYTVEQRDLYPHIIELMQGSLASPRFGGDADHHAGGARPDTIVNIVALFSGPVLTDAQGNVTVALDIPDFNGKLRLMAVAFNDHQFGAASSEINVAAPVIANASLPRFLAAGDQSFLTLDVHNLSGSRQNLSLNFSTNALLTLEHKHLTLQLDDQQQQMLRLPLRTAKAFGPGEIRLSLHNNDASAEAITIKRKWQLGVRPAYPGINKVIRKIVNSGQSVKLTMPTEDLLPASLSSQLIISAQPPLNLRQQFKALLHYPYGCLEQTISSSYPWLTVTPENIQTLGLDKIRIEDKAIQAINRVRLIDKAISHLASMQRSNGGFGLWRNTDPEEYWLSVYTADFLLDARTAGFQVPGEMLNKLLQRLQIYINNRGPLYGQGYSQAPGHLEFAYKTYAAYILSRVNRTKLGTLRTLYEQHRKAAKSGLPLLHLGLALMNQGDKTLAQQAISEALLKARDEQDYLGDYGSKLRDLAVMTKLLHEQPDTNPADIEQLVFKLADELNNRNYLSTQERLALFRAAQVLVSQQQTTWQGQLLLDGSTVNLAQRNNYQNSFENSRIPQQIVLQSEYDKPLYIQAALQGYPKQAPVMRMNAIHVERQYFTLDNKPVQAEQFESGAVLLVHVSLWSDQRIKDALAVELLPAGFELENQQLENSLKTDSFRIGDKSIAEMQSGSNIKFREYLDDRFIAAVDLHKNHPEHLFYLVRAVTPGHYTNPPAYVEDMYRPYLRAIGRHFNDITITANK